MYRDGDTRGISNVLGIALLFGIVIAGMFVTLTIGGVALDETRSGLDTGRAEKTLTQFDSRSAMVALGGTSHQGVDLAVGSREGYRVEPEVGWMNVTVYNETADEHAEVVKVTLGAVVYENGNEAVAYQGGGVWKDTEAGATMLSPPEFHFRDATLTLPLITVDGQGTLGGSAEVTKNGPTQVRYPNQGVDENFTNPMEDGHVNVTVHSEYYEAWGRYFAERTEGEVFYDHDAESARIKLSVPFDESYDSVVATTTPGGLDVNGNNDPPDPHETGVNYPLADSRIDDRIEECETDPGACDAFDTSSVDTITTSGTYYTDDGYDDELVVDDPGGNVTVVVDGTFEPSSVSITDGHNTTVLVRNSETNGVVFGSNDLINSGGEAGDLSVVVHSNVDRVKGNGNYEFVGLLYAPGSECQFDGGGAYEPDIEGGIVCERASLNGNPNDFDYDDSVEGIDLDLGGDIIPITYLHVTENPVNVTSG